MRLYMALADEQIEQIKSLLREFNTNHRKDKRLYELHYRVFDLNPFQRNTNTNIYCIREGYLEDVQDPKLAKTVLSQSFGPKVIEFR